MYSCKRQALFWHGNVLERERTFQMWVRIAILVVTFRFCPQKSSSANLGILSFFSFSHSKGLFLNMFLKASLSFSAKCCKCKVCVSPIVQQSLPEANTSASLRWYAQARSRWNWGAQESSSVLQSGCDWPRCSFAWCQSGRSRACRRGLVWR